MNKKFLFQLNHPAHYHLFKNVIKYLKEHGHTVLIAARGKDVLENLLVNEDYIMLSTRKGKTLWEKIRLIKHFENEVLSVVKKFNPDIIIGTGTFSYVTKKLGIPSFFFGEDDVNINLPILLGAFTCYSNFTELFAPTVCNNLFWNKRTIKYNGYHELAYLHPNHFTPQKEIVEKYFSICKPYFILRFAQLNAYHDVGIKGINTNIAQSLIEILKPYGDIYITSERELEPQFEQYRIKINPLDMHHVMTFASLYVGDSQTMAAEAGVLGIPFIRFNDFVGKISYLKELEDVYKLGFGIKTKDVSVLYNTVEMLLKMENRSEIFQERRFVMLSEKIDCSLFFTWFIENYPQSKQIIHSNPNYQFEFR